MTCSTPRRRAYLLQLCVVDLADDSGTHGGALGAQCTTVVRYAQVAVGIACLRDALREQRAREQPAQHGGAAGLLATRRCWI